MGRSNICTILEGRSWVEILGGLLQHREIDKLNALPRSKVLNAVQLEQAVGKTRASHLLRRTTILPEIAQNGKKRCIYVYDNTLRCRQYTDEGMCGCHMSAVENFTKHFKSRKIKDQFLTFVNDPQKMRLTGEMAMLRVMIVQMIGRVQGDDMPIQTIQAVTVLCEKVMNMATTISKMNQLTPEVVDNILNKTIEIMSKYLPPDRLVEAAKEISLLATVDPSANSPIEPGQMIEVENDLLEITSTVDENKQIQRNTLLNEAIRLQSELVQLQTEVDIAEST